MMGKLLPILATGRQTWQLTGTEMEVEVILASTAKDSPPIYTLRMRYPRIIHAEVMTHRVFSRNARSSRAVPVQTMLDEIRNSPFVPWHWGANQKGMQAGEECDELVSFAHYLPGPLLKNQPQGVIKEVVRRSPRNAWLEACTRAADIAEGFMKAGYHKQICNRLLEPFMWIDVLVTSTDWKNFLWLRDHEAAEPHIRDLARLVDVAIQETQPYSLEPGQWHRPYITGDDVDHWMDLCDAKSDFDLVLNKISAARCARISYKPFDGDASYERELERYDSLVSSDRVHASPLEHQAQACVTGISLGGHPMLPNSNRKLRGNLAPGWNQFRKTIPNESYHD